jgi:membrane associated rhomboid family serine protease
MIVLLLVVVGLVIRGMTPQERRRVIDNVITTLRRRWNLWLRGRQASEPFRLALRARTPWLAALPALVAINVAVVVTMKLTGGIPASDDLLRWGAGFAPRTTNWEWWRLVTYMWVHTGLLQLLANVLGLVAAGVIVERVIGWVAFVAVYVAAGVIAGLISLSAAPVAIVAGASGAVLGICGVLAAMSLWGLIRSSGLAIPVLALKRLAPALTVFGLFNLVDGSVPILAELAGLGTGFVYGALLSQIVAERKPANRLVGATMTATLVFAVAYAVPLRGISDVRPELARIIDTERQTSIAYRDAYDGFLKGRSTAEAVAQVIDKVVLPEMKAAAERLGSFDRVPADHQALIDEAQEYLKLRSESWRLRAESLRERRTVNGGRARAEADYRASLSRRGRADAAERAALEALRRLQEDSGPPKA